MAVAIPFPGITARGTVAPSTTPETIRENLGVGISKEAGAPTLTIPASSLPGAGETRILQIDENGEVTFLDSLIFLPPA